MPKDPFPMLRKLLPSLVNSVAGVPRRIQTSPESNPFLERPPEFTPTLQTRAQASFNLRLSDLISLLLKLGQSNILKALNVFAKSGEIGTGERVQDKEAG